MTPTAEGVLVFSGNEPDGCAAFIRAVIRHAFHTGKQYDRRWMTSFASSCLVSHASIWLSSLSPLQRTQWIPFCHAMLAQYPPRPSEEPQLATAQPSPRPPLGIKYSNTAQKETPALPSAHGLLRLDFFDPSVPSRYLSSQLRIGYATVYKADLDHSGRGQALSVSFERSERGAFKLWTTDDQTTCIALDKKSPDLSYLALVPHYTSAWSSNDPQSLQTDVWNVSTEGIVQLSWQQAPAPITQNNTLQRYGGRVPLGVVCHLKSGTVEIMRNASQYCAKYQGWYEVMLMFEPFSRPEWMSPPVPNRESVVMSPTSMRSPGSQKLKKKRASQRMSMSMTIGSVA